MQNLITQEYIKNTEKMNKMNITVDINSSSNYIYIRNHNNQKDFIISGRRGEDFYAEIIRLWHKEKDLPLDVAIIGHTYLKIVNWLEQNKDIKND